MQCLTQQQDLLGLKIEDHSDHYLFNSLLALGHHDQPSYLYGEPDQFSFNCRDQDQRPTNTVDRQTEIIINDLSQIYDLRTAPLDDLIGYSDQVYGLSESTRLNLLRDIRRHKLRLKRQNAKKRAPLKLKSEESLEEVKAEDSLLPMTFQDESQETKKKKRNRMSAQKSRDRKKEYIKEIEKVNQELRNKIEELGSKNLQKLKPASRDFLKVLLCLGITCFISTNSSPALPTTIECKQEALIDEERPSAETISPSEPLFVLPQLDFDYYKKMLPVSQQLMLSEALVSLNSNQDHLKEESDITNQPGFRKKGSNKRMSSQNSSKRPPSFQAS